MTYPAADPFDDLRRHRRQRLPRWVGPVVLGLIVLSVIALFVLRGPQIGVRQSDQKIISVVLPPPPPPPPPPEQTRPPEPKPTLAPPTPAPQTPPPPTQAPPQAATDTSALTARAGAGPSSYGLAQGNGGGARIGGGAGDNGFGEYAGFASAEIRRATQSDPALASGQYSVTIAVHCDPDGRIIGVRLLEGAGDAKRDAALQRRLVGFQLSRRPPSGLPVMRLQVNVGSGG